MSERTRYLFNRNASTHSHAIVRFATISSIIAGLLSLAIPLVMMPDNRSEDTYNQAFRMALVIFVLTYSASFGAMTMVYMSLLRIQYHSPTPHKRRRNIDVYANGVLWNPKSGDRVGED